MSRKVYLIDTTALIHDVHLNDDVEIFVVEGVLDEAKSLKAKLRTEIILSKSKIYKPSKENVTKAIRIAKELGEHNLTKTDIEIIASALELSESYGSDLIVITDDYSIQNILSYLNINFKKIATKGISKTIKWINFCPVCKLKFDAKLENCLNCGSKLIKIKNAVYNP
jgi:Predicted nucleic acid-binding protein, consists of a PIN domain and a Zn-ribbon module